MIPKFSAQLIRILRSVNTSKQLEKIASDFQDDPEIFEKAATVKIMVDAEIFSMIKKAGVMGELGRKALTGAAYGTGAALPVALGGSYLLDRAGDETKETTEDIRNKVLQAALGVGGIGAGLYGLHRLVGGDPVDINQIGNALQGRKKQAAHDANDAEELVEKLAAVGMIEEMLDRVNVENLSSDAQKLAAEIRIINRGYGVQLLHEASRR